MVNYDGEEAALGSDLSFEAEELAAQKTALIGRTVAILLIAVLTSFLTPWPGPLYLYFLLALFMVLGFAAYRVARAPWRKPWYAFAFVTAEFSLLTFTLIYPNPLVLLDLPPQIGLRFGNFIYFFVLLAGLAYLYRPSLVLWGGLSAAVSWFVGVTWLASLPNAVWRPPVDGDVAAFLVLIADPNFIDLGVRVQEVAVLLITAGLLAMAVNRARAIALRRANLASERTNLARYFPRKTVDMLARKTSPLSQPREHNAAVLFADIVAFTTWSENRPPAATIAVLREVHGLLAETVFKHDGTLDKFIGDGLMATFGTPEPSRRDAVNALSAAVEMVEVFETWRRSRRAGEGSELKLAIGVHYGPIVLGDIGSNRRMEFAVLGDTVNVASRLENANREIGSRCIVSAGLVEAAKSENPSETAATVAKLDPYGPLALRGHSDAMSVLILP
jgi:adenylate cyclase